LGGLKVISKINTDKANLLYNEIDRNKLFVSPLADNMDRSVMNVVFVLKPEYKELEEKFLELAKSKGLVGIKGHRSVGGFRASIYNAMPVEGIEVLVNAMKEFEKQV
jgi:phosphoserine aminotransferase